MDQDWIHSICVTCWNEQRPSKPVGADDSGTSERCCFCGERHSSGIYVRQDPATVRCGGVHEEAPAPGRTHRNDRIER